MSLTPARRLFQNERVGLVHEYAHPTVLLTTWELMMQEGPEPYYSRAQTPHCPWWPLGRVKKRLAHVYQVLARRRTRCEE